MAENTMVKTKITVSQTIVDTIIDRQLNMKHHELHVNPRVISRASEG